MDVHAAIEALTAYLTWWSWKGPGFGVDVGLWVVSAGGALVRYVDYREFGSTRRLNARVLLLALFFGWLVGPVSPLILTGLVLYAVPCSIGSVIHAAELPRLPRVSLARRQAPPSAGQLSLGTPNAEGQLSQPESSGHSSAGD